MLDVFRDERYIGTFQIANMDKETGILTIKDEKGANLKIGDVMVFSDGESKYFKKDKIKDK